MAVNLYRYSAPAAFYPVAGLWAPWFGVAAAACAVVGLYIGFVVAPTDFQQGEAYRIIFIHVPAAWMSMFIYVVMAFWAGMGLVLNIRLSSMMATALAPTGALMTFIALWTGALWGKPTWGTWWVWDARLTSELILLFLYIGFIALQAAIDEPRRADRAGALLALVGVVNIPIIYFSVRWWNTLHQGASVSMTAAPKMAMTMLWGMLIMALAAWAYAIAASLMRVRAIIAIHVGQRLGHPVQERFRADKAVIGQHIGARRHMLTPAEPDFEMQRALIAEQHRRSDRPFRRHGDARQQAIDQPLLPLAQGLAFGPAIKAVDRGRVTGFVSGHARASGSDPCTGPQENCDGRLPVAMVSSTHVGCGPNSPFACRAFRKGARSSAPAGQRAHGQIDRRAIGAQRTVDQRTAARCPAQDRDRQQPRTGPLAGRPEKS